MVLQHPDVPGHLEANFETVRAVALTEVGGQSLLLLKPTGLHPQGHTGGTLAKPGSPAYAALEAFVARARGEHEECGAGTPEAPACEIVAPGRRRVRLLNRAEYDRTIRDLFGFESSHGKGFVAENVVQGFDNHADARTVSPLLADQLHEASLAIADQAVAPASLAALLPCDTQDSACASAFIADFGKRAFRRPLLEADLARYEALYGAVSAEDGFVEGVRYVIVAMLQSPHFLYRPELGEADADGYKLTPWEIATELSYFIWGSMPDEALFARAEAGELADPDVVEEEARRMLKDPRAREQLEHFVVQWLELGQLPHVPREVPELTDALRAAMLAETTDFVEAVLIDGSGRFDDLLTADWTVAGPELAAWYGLEGSGELSLPPESHRRGLLTHASVLTAHAFASSSSPIHRGMLVRERLLCQDLPPPPPGLIVEPPPVDPTLSTRERFAAHATEEACSSCHRLMDPIGFGFEHFDEAGRYREMDGVHEVDDSGEILGSIETDATFEGVQELSDVLAESYEVQACFATQWFRYAYGVEEHGALSCVLDSVQSEFLAADLSYEELVVALVRSPHFLRRGGDDAEDVIVAPDPVVPDPDPTDPDPEPDPVDPDPEPDPDPIMSGDVKVATAVDSSWTTGYCMKVEVTNEGTSPVTWAFELEIEGAINDIWNAEFEVVSGQIMRFVGAWYNGTLDPGATTHFGFCAQTGGPVPQPDPDPVDPDPEPDPVDPDPEPDPDPPADPVDVGDDALEVTVTNASSWDAGKCDDVALTNVSAAPVTWSITLPVPGTINNHWDSNASDNGDGTTTFTGVSYNATLQPGASTTFGYCTSF